MKGVGAEEVAALVAAMADDHTENTVMMGST